MRIIDINGAERECARVAPDKNFPGFMKVEYHSKTRRGYTHSEWYPVAEFVKNNPKLANLTKGAGKLPKEDLGVATKATKDSLTDKTKTWLKNVFAGYPIWISRGKGEGQTRTIATNTTNRLVINKPWEIIPDKTSQYVISHNIHNPQRMGNLLPGMGKGLPVKKMKKKRKEKSLS